MMRITTRSVRLTNLGFEKDALKVMSLAVVYNIFPHAHYFVHYHNEIETLYVRVAVRIAVFHTDHNCSIDWPLPTAWRTQDRASCTLR